MAVATIPVHSQQTTVLKQQPSLSFAEYIEQERNNDVKHDFYFGELIEVAGATYEHNVISANMIGAFVVALEETDCRVLGSDQKIYVSPSVGYYPDIVVTCGAPLITLQEALQNPLLIAEILSPSTAANDRGEKFRQYRTLSSLKHYLLLEQDRPIIEHYEHDDSGTWVLRGDYNSLEQNLNLTIDGQTIVLPLSKIYRNITFPDSPASAQIPETTEE
jgi:Uma2 family endonuclease